MTATAPLLSRLRVQHPEWEPWLDVVEVALRESQAPVWDEMVPQSAPAGGAAPRLAGATLRLQKAVVESYLERLLRVAARSHTRELATLGTSPARSMDGLSLFRAALCQQPDRMAQAAVRCGVHPDALQAVAALVPVPFLQACTRSWRSTHHWVEPYCPVCGAWPAFAEVRGIERSRYYRCGRCGGEWLAHGLSCPFCATSDHRDLVRLVPGDPGAAAAIEACRKCRGYVKMFNRLQGCAAPAVLLEDLAGVALDLAALEQGYSRPATAAYVLDLTVTATASSRRFLEWNADTSG